MIIETIVSTVNSAGEPNFAPMGFIPLSKEAGLLRPFKGTHTYDNLKEQGAGVINVVDDVLLFVETALYSAVPPHLPATFVQAPLLKEATTCYEFKVTDFQGNGERAEVSVEILLRSNRRYFLGYCRATFAVLEAAILVTRLDLLGSARVVESMKFFGELVNKTGGEREKRAFHMVERFLHHGISRQS